LIDGATFLRRSSLEKNANAGNGRSQYPRRDAPLDSLSLDSGIVAIVKIDVEGHEMRTLEGLTGILEQSHPSSSLSPKRASPRRPATIFNFLKKYGYRASSAPPIGSDPCGFSVGEFQK